MRIISSCIAISLSIMTFFSCTPQSTTRESEISNSIPDNYNHLLSELRAIDTLSVDSLAERIKQWISIRNSFAEIVRNDTVNPHPSVHEEWYKLDDSLKLEFSRIVTSKAYSFTDILAIKNCYSTYNTYGHFIKAADAIRPFFDTLSGSIPKSNEKNDALSFYRLMLSDALNDSIECIEDLQDFIRKEDVAYRGFIANLDSYGDMDLSDITRDTERCCSIVFNAAKRGKISYRDATIYMAMRTNRRVIHNVQACLDDISEARIYTKEQAWAYVCMILQPYVSLDGLCFSLLSQKEKKLINRIASDTPMALTALQHMMGSETDKLEELPGMLLEVMILSY